MHQSVALLEHEQKKTKKCSPRRLALLAGAKSLRGRVHAAVSARSKLMRTRRALCAACAMTAKHSERDGQLTGSRCVCGRGMVHNRDDDKFDRDKNGSNDVMIRLNTVEEVKPPRF